MNDVELVEVKKHYGDRKAVDGVSLQIARGEFLTLLGPSGCGKTTILRLIAGFEEPDGGSIRIGGQSWPGCLLSGATSTPSSSTTRFFPT